MIVRPTPYKSVRTFLQIERHVKAVCGQGAILILAKLGRVLVSGLWVSIRCHVGVTVGGSPQVGHHRLEVEVVKAVSILALAPAQYLAAVIRDPLVGAARCSGPLHRMGQNHLLSRIVDGFRILPGVALRRKSRFTSSYAVLRLVIEA